MAELELGERGFRGRDGVYYRAALSRVDPRSGRRVPGLLWVRFTDGEGHFVAAVAVPQGVDWIGLDTDELRGLLEAARNERS